MNKFLLLLLPLSFFYSFYSQCDSTIISGDYIISSNTTLSGSYYVTGNFEVIGIHLIQLLIYDLKCLGAPYNVSAGIICPVSAGKTERVTTPLWHK